MRISFIFCLLSGKYDVGERVGKCVGVYLYLCVDYSVCPCFYIILFLLIMWIRVVIYVFCCWWVAMYINMNFVWWFWICEFCRLSRVWFHTHNLVGICGCYILFNPIYVLCNYSCAVSHSHVGCARYWLAGYVLFIIYKIHSYSGTNTRTYASSFSLLSLASYVSVGKM